MYVYIKYWLVNNVMEILMTSDFASSWVTSVGCALPAMRIFDAPMNNTWNKKWIYFLRSNFCFRMLNAEQWRLHQPAADRYRELGEPPAWCFSFWDEDCTNSLHGSNPLPFADSQIIPASVGCAADLCLSDCLARHARRWPELAAAAAAH